MVYKEHSGASDFSPSLYHRYVMDNIQQTMRYDGGDAKEWQKKLRRKFRQLVGPIPKNRVPLNVRSLWRREHKLGTIEKIVFTSEPYSDVPAYVCLPENTSPPYTFFICLHGHNTGMHNSIAVDQLDETKSIAVDDDRDFALGCMERGIAALCIEQRSFGERQERVQKNPAARCYDAMMQASLLGISLTGERVFDVDRAIDYLASREDVDMERLGVMGLSGGGMITICVMALLPRVRFAMPASHFCTYKGGLLARHHCGCCYVPGIYQYAEMADVAGLFAPRPVVIVTGKDDASKPVESVQEAFKDLKKIYRAMDAEENCHLVVGNGGHRFYAEEGWGKMIPLLRAS